MFIKSDGYSKKVLSNRLMALILVLVGISLMVFAVVSPIIKGLLAVLVFIIGYGIFEKPWNKLTEHW